MGRRTDIDPRQQVLGFDVVLVPQGNGEYLLKPGKPKLRGETLTPEELAEEFRVSRDTIYRWRQDGWISDEHVEFAGRRRLRIKREAIDTLREKFKELHD
jgi:excisionase family DNA binding protein